MSSTFAFNDPWRDELTPRTRASRRRWTALEAALLLAVGATALSADLRDALAGTGDGRGLFLFIALLVVYGVLQRGTRRLGSLRGGDGGLDERDLASRHRAFRTAFGLFLLVLLATLVCLPAALPDGATRSSGGELTSGSFLADSDVTTLGFWLFAWAVFLPTAALAWREPDAPPLDDDDVRPVLGEGVRDVLLLVALVGGAMIAVTSPGDQATLQSLVLPFVPFALFVCVIGFVRGRRSGDGPLRASVRGWRIVLALALVTLACLGLGISGNVEVQGSGTSTQSGRAAVVSTGYDRVRDGRRCLEIVDGKGRVMTGAAARREARRMAEEPSSLCER